VTNNIFTNVNNNKNVSNIAMPLQDDHHKDNLSSSIVKEKPNIQWDDVAGLDQAKSALKEAVILPSQFPELFTGKRKPWKGILLYGPPGTGKSFLAKAVATEAKSTFYSISSSDLVSKYQGESERLIKNLFDMARESIPSIVFIDEIDSICGNRTDDESDFNRRIKTEFLVQMQGVNNENKGVLILGATNTPWSLDPAIRRRFEKRIYIPLPDEEARLTMIQLNIGDTPNNIKEEDYQELSLLSEGFSGSDINVAIRDAIMEPLRQCQHAMFFTKINEKFTPSKNACMYCSVKDVIECTICGCIKMSLMDVPKEMLNIPDVTFDHVKSAIIKTKSSVSHIELKRFDEWTLQFGQMGV